MRILAIGDIHGCSRAFVVLLDAVQPQRDDLIITLGDYVDRGPDPAGVIERLLRLKKTHRLVSLRGNHELMLLAKRGDKAGAGRPLLSGGQGLGAYSIPTGDGNLVEVPVPDSHWDFLEGDCVNYFETDRYFVVHANADPDVALADQPDYMLFWVPFYKPAPHRSGKVMVCGHTGQLSGVPANLGHAVCIDTRAYGGGWLTCLDVETGEYWQANQAGQCRKGRLSKAE